LMVMPAIPTARFPPPANGDAAEPGRSMTLALLGPAHVVSKTGSRDRPEPHWPEDAVPQRRRCGARDLRKRVRLYPANIPRPAAGSCLRRHLAAYACPETTTAPDRVVILVGDIGLDDTSQQFGDAITIAIAGSRVACDLAPATVG
jgi:hypothetical protein